MGVEKRNSILQGYVLVFDHCITGIVYGIPAGMLSVRPGCSPWCKGVCAG